MEKYAPFEKVFLVILNKHASLKKKVVRANHSPYITKTFRTAIKKQSYLENVYFKKKTPDSLRKFKKQKNYCSRRYKKEWKNISQVLIQEGSVTIKVFGKIYNLFSLKNES